jgi:class 3 adenylate cyclase
MSAIHLDVLNRLRKKAKLLSHQVILQHEAHVLWPYLSNSDILDKKIGLAAVDYHFEPDSAGGSRIHAQTTFGGLKTHYIELPYQWLPPHYFSVERIFQNGWLRYLAVKWYLDDTPAGGCLVQVQLHYVPRYPLIPLKQMGQTILNRMIAFFKKTDASVPVQPVLSFDAFFEKNAAIEKKIIALAHRWNDLIPHADIPMKVAEYIYTAPDKYVHKIRPFEIADYFNLSRLEVLTFCLLATKAGFLDLSWDILCPSCRGNQNSVAHLWHLNAAAHCDTCNIHYDAHFDRNVEVTFKPKENLRSLDTHTYCIANPAATGHIWAQITLEPHETRSIAVYLPTGAYRLYSLSRSGEIILHTDKKHSTTALSLDLKHKSLYESAPLHLAEHITLLLSNPTAHWLTLKVEKLNYRERVATAALVTSLQDFRDLFSAAEVLRPHMQLGISHIVVLFSDLVGSTQLYEQKGDANAFGLVQEHFDLMIPLIRSYQGGVVKTIGDAVMAVFTESTLALQAGLHILKTFAERNQHRPLDEQIIIKLGLHQGACIVLNLNDKLDYFGNTVNKAARIQGVSQGQDMVISELLFQQIHPLLPHYPSLTITPFTAELKGIQRKNTLYRLHFAESIVK